MGTSIMGTVDSDTQHEVKDLKDEHVEDQPAETSLYRPAYRDYGLMRSFKAFRPAVVWIVLVSFGAVFDAFAGSIVQNLLANPGWIARMASVEVAGVPTIDAFSISIWSVVQQATQIGSMLILPWFADKFGRKPILWALCFAITADGLIGIFASNWRVFCAARFFAGLAAGLTQVGINTYASEVSPTNVRGAMITLYAISFAFGSFLANFVTYAISVSSPSSYRIAFYCEIGMVITFLPGALFAPESPLWLIRHGQEESAKKSIKRLYCSEPSYDVEREYENMLILIEEERSRVAVRTSLRDYLDCFRGTNLRRTIISTLPLASQFATGLILFLGYATYFFQLAGYPKPFEAGLIIQSVLLFFTITATFATDKVGRRPLVLFGTTICGVCNLVMGGLGFAKAPPGGLLVFLACLWAASYASGLGPVSWTYLAETSSADLRAKTVGIATAITACFNLMWGFTVPLMLSPTAAGWGLKTGLLFGPTSIICAIAMFFILPETRSRTFAELDEMFTKGVPTRRFKTYVTDAQNERDAQHA